MMQALTRAAEAVADCVNAPVWALSNDELVAALDAAHRLQQQVGAVVLGLVREVDGRDLGAAQGATSTGVWLRERLRVGVPAARRMVQLAKALDSDLPRLRDAVVEGAVTVEQAQVIAAAVRALPDDVGADVVDKAAAVLVEAAGQFDPAVLRGLGERILTLVAPEVAEEHERILLERAEERAYQRRGLTIGPDGMGGVRLTGLFDTESAAVITAAIDPLCRPAPGTTGESGAPGRPGRHRWTAAVARPADSRAAPRGRAG